YASLITHLLAVLLFRRIVALQAEAEEVLGGAGGGAGEADLRRRAAEEEERRRRRRSPQPLRRSGLCFVFRWTGGEYCLQARTCRLSQTWIASKRWPASSSCSSASARPPS